MGRTQSMMIYCSPLVVALGAAGAGVLISEVVRSKSVFSGA